jgi:hypothetical protein
MIRVEQRDLPREHTVPAVAVYPPLHGAGRQRNEIAEFAEGPAGVALQQAEQLMIDFIERRVRFRHATILRRGGKTFNRVRPGCG